MEMNNLFAYIFPVSNNKSFKICKIDLFPDRLFIEHIFKHLF